MITTRRGAVALPALAQSWPTQPVRLVAPARTPPEIIGAAAADAILRDPEIAGRWAAQGAVPGGGTPAAFAATPAAFAALIQRTRDDVGPVIRAAGIRAE